jgi:hypothetical protein
MNLTVTINNIDQAEFKDMADFGISAALDMGIVIKHPGDNFEINGARISPKARAELFKLLLCPYLSQAHVDAMMPRQD